MPGGTQGYPIDNCRSALARRLTTFSGLRAESAVCRSLSLSRFVPSALTQLTFFAVAYADASAPAGLPDSLRAHLGEHEQLESELRRLAHHEAERSPPRRD